MVTNVLENQLLQKKRIQRDFDQFGNACNTIKLSKEGLKYITVSMEYAKILFILLVI